MKLLCLFRPRLTRFRRPLLLSARPIPKTRRHDYVPLTTAR